MKIKLEENQIWINEEKPYLSIIIKYIDSLFDNTEEGVYVVWEIYDKDSWEEYVLQKKFNGIGTLEENIKNGKSTFPYAIAGECSVRSMKQKIRKNKLKLLTNN